jgi:hypothetical protein
MSNVFVAPYEPSKGSDISLSGKLKYVLIRYLSMGMGEGLNLAKTDAPFAV